MQCSTMFVATGREILPEARFPGPLGDTSKEAKRIRAVDIELGKLEDSSKRGRAYKDAFGPH